MWENIDQIESPFYWLCITIETDKNFTYHFSKLFVNVCTNKTSGAEENGVWSEEQQLSNTVLITVEVCQRCCKNYTERKNMFCVLTTDNDIDKRCLINFSKIIPVIGAISSELNRIQ